MKHPLIAIIVLLVCGVWSAAACAHEVRPAYLMVRQTGADTYDVLWKVPARGDMRLGIYVTFPPGTEQLTLPRKMMIDDAYVERWTLRHPGGLSGGVIRVRGLEATRIDVLARIEHLNGAAQTARVLPDNPTFMVEAAPSVWSVGRTYFILGVEHILLGIDHLLFVLVLVLLVKGWKRLTATITMFTVAHSVTLALAALGVVNVPGPPVEACIALSIVFVAAEVVRSRCAKSTERPALTKRAPWIVAFTFGLLHGLGFAGALSDVGLPSHAIPWALLFFNIGVEIGQLLFVLFLLCLSWMSQRSAVPVTAWGWRVATYSIGAVAVFWSIERIAAF